MTNLTTCSYIGWTFSIYLFVTFEPKTQGNCKCLNLIGEFEINQIRTNCWPIRWEKNHFRSKMEEYQSIHPEIPPLVTMSSLTVIFLAIIIYYFKEEAKRSKQKLLNRELVLKKTEYSARIHLYMSICSLLDMIAVLDLRDEWIPELDARRTYIGISTSCIGIFILLITQCFHEKAKRDFHMDDDPSGQFVKVLLLCIVIVLSLCCSIVTISMSFSLNYKADGQEWIILLAINSLICLIIESFFNALDIYLKDSNPFSRSNESLYFISKYLNQSYRQRTSKYPEEHEVKNMIKDEKRSPSPVKSPKKKELETNQRDNGKNETEAKIEPVPQMIKKMRENSAKATIPKMTKEKEEKLSDVMNPEELGLILNKTQSVIKGKLMQSFEKVGKLRNTVNDGKKVEKKPSTTSLQYKDADKK